MTFKKMQRRQLRLSVSLAIVFLVSVFAIPFLNQAAPGAMLTPVLGLPFVWLYVGVPASFLSIVLVSLATWERQPPDVRDALESAIARSMSLNAGSWQGQPPSSGRGNRAPFDEPPAVSMPAPGRAGCARTCPAPPR